MRIMKFIRQKNIYDKREKEFYILPTIRVDKGYGIFFVFILWWNLKFGAMMCPTKTHKLFKKWGVIE